MKHFRQTALACLIDCTSSAYTGMRHAVGAALAIVLDGQRSGHDRSQCTIDQGPVEKEGRHGGPLKLLT